MNTKTVLPLGSLALALALFACGDDGGGETHAREEHAREEHGHDEHGHDEHAHGRDDARRDEGVTGVAAAGSSVALSFQSAQASHVADGGTDLNRLLREDARAFYAIVSGFGPTLPGAAAAADTAVSPFRTLAERGDVTGDAVAAAALEANASLVRTRPANAEEVHGATFVAATLSRGQIEIAHVGDALVFRLRDGALTRLVLGHTVVEDFIRERQLEGESAEELRANAPHREVIVRALGVRNEVPIARHRENVQPGDVLVLASSALHLALGFERMKTILAQTEGGPTEKARALVDAASTHEGADTASAIVIEARAAD